MLNQPHTIYIYIYTSYIPLTNLKSNLPIYIQHLCLMVCRFLSLKSYSLTSSIAYDNNGRR